LPAPAAGRRFDAVADEFLPEGHYISTLLEKVVTLKSFLWTFFLHNYIR
jgi:hypothetical protein